MSEKHNKNYKSKYALAYERIDANRQRQQNGSWVVRSQQNQQQLQQQAQQQRQQQIVAAQQQRQVAAQQQQLQQQQVAAQQQRQLQQQQQLLRQRQQQQFQQQQLQQQQLQQQQLAAAQQQRQLQQQRQQQLAAQQRQQQLVAAQQQRQQQAAQQQAAQKQQLAAAQLQQQRQSSALQQQRGVFQQNPIQQQQQQQTAQQQQRQQQSSAQQQQGVRQQKRDAAKRQQNGSRVVRQQSQQQRQQQQRAVRQRYSERARYVEQRGSGSNKKRIVIAFAALVLVALIIIASVVLTGKGSNSSTPNDGISGAVNSLVKDDRLLPTPIMAEVDGVQMHCAVTMEDLTELLFHNASYTYAYQLSTQLTEANNAEIMAAHGTGRRPSTQPTGNAWMTGQFIRTFRSESAGPQMSAIDCGGAPGTKVYAPVSGEVVLVKEYQLYGQYPDVQIHIRPEGRSDLDCVLIHLQNPTVKQGDTVVAGESELAEIRDVYAYIGESMQLKQYTAEGDNGNHTHIQMNNVNDPDYHGLDDIK